MKSKKATKVFVGMSGGVDSSVSAALLRDAGYDVTGVFIKVWQPDWIECTWREERHEAMRVAAHLGIPFVTLDLEKEYKQYVIDYMIDEYKLGRTPNPDIMCNREVKFGGFWKWAKEQGADHIATGHYARVHKLRIGCFRLLTSIDTNKDQSYFLWTLNKSDLPHILFPVGHLEKPEVRKLARKFKLPNAEKKDSQGLCFIGKIDVKDFLSHYIEQKPGKLLNEKAEIIGTHEGSLLMTIGERRGFTVDAKHKTPHDEPYYVVAKNVEENTVTVSNRKNYSNKSQYLNPKEIQISNIERKITSIYLSKVNWTCDALKVGDKVEIRVRYRQALTPATIKGIDTERCLLSVEPAKEIDAVTPGQSLVMYRGEECLGGGIID